LIIGDGVGGPDADVVQLNGDNQMVQPGSTSDINVTVNSSGLLDLNNHSDIILSLFLQGSDIRTGAGTLRIRDVTTLASSRPASISGNLNVGAAFTVADSPGVNDDLLVTASLSAGGTVRKLGPGRLVLSGAANNVAGFYLEVDAGILTLRNNQGLGSGSTLSPVTGGAVEIDHVSGGLGDQPHGPDPRPGGHQLLDGPRLRGRDVGHRLHRRRGRWDADPQRPADRQQPHQGGRRHIDAGGQRHRLGAGHSGRRDAPGQRHPV
jgi:hypothetical protein